MAESNRDWLARKTLEECSLQFRTVWDIYIKWYTIFLTFNIAGIGVAAQHLKGLAVGVVALTFVAENLISLLTAIYIARFSISIERRALEAAAWLASEGESGQKLPEKSSSPIVQFPIPGSLGFWSGWANAASHLFLMICWVAIYILRNSSTSLPGS